MFCSKGIDQQIVELMEIDDISWGILMICVVLNAVVTQHLLPSKPPPGEYDPQFSHIIFIAAGFLLLCCFVGIFSRLRIMTAKVRSGKVSDTRLPSTH